jgi:hypothetical protein
MKRLGLLGFVFLGLLTSCLTGTGPAATHTTGDIGSTATEREVSPPSSAAAADPVDGIEPKGDIHHICDSTIEDCKAPPVKWRIQYGSDLSQTIAADQLITVTVTKPAPFATKLLLQGLSADESQWESRAGTVRLLLCPAGKPVSECQGCIAAFTGPSPESYDLSLPLAAPSSLQFFRDDANAQGLADCKQPLQPSEGFIYEQPQGVFLGSLYLDVVFNTKFDDPGDLNNIDPSFNPPPDNPPSDTKPTWFNTLKNVWLKLP